MSRLDDSKTIIARIIANLEDNGVIATALHVSDFYSDYTSEDALLFSSAISWLAAENVIRFRGEPIPDDADDTNHYSAVLTSFGFLALERELSSALTLRDQLKEARAGARNWASVGDLVGGILGGFSKTISNG
ncbi:hypothetical protein MU516_12425 [Paracoccus sp. YLB-12]|uniref:DUF2513 domain-containing protein n=1 Tax=Paracoccus maritimus TaxID=2933292 RepID=A0ABT2KAX4_9RHOB|nr:hypothetical protein [Paracoccus sp. YLB-12]MCT4333671.1 hypothetical protein [Paracoccus sp. YLB-12]